MSETRTGNAREAMVNRIKCSGTIQKTGLPCTAWAKPGTDRCMFHPRSAEDVEQAQSDGVTIIPVSPHVLQERLAQSESAPSPADLAATDEFDVPEDAGEAELLAAEAAASDDEVAPGYKRVAVYDGDKEDYVVKVVRQDEVQAARVHVADPDTFTDAFALGDEYRKGDSALFDFRWCVEDEKQNLSDRTNGFVPVRKSLDNRHTVRGGVVTYGDLVLMRRPKEVTEQRARAQAILHDRRVGDPLAEYEEEARATAREAGVDVPITGGMSESVGQFATESDPDNARRRQAARPEPARPRGATSFAFPNNPLGRDRVAERHRSVGG